MPINGIVSDFRSGYYLNFQTKTYFTININEVFRWKCMEKIKIICYNEKRKGGKNDKN